MRADEACPVCEGRELEPRFTKGGRAFGRCTECDLVRQYPIPSPDELRAYYERHYGVDGRLREMFLAEEMVRVRASYRLGEVRPLLPASRWLDVGASGGAFVAAARAAGIDAEGIDVAAGAVERAQAAGHPIQRATIEDHAAVVPAHTYDALTAFDVFEHVPDPLSFVTAARRLIRPAGMLALAVPNQQSVSCRLMGKHWYFYIPDAHLYTFNARNLRRLLARGGFDVVHESVTFKPITCHYALGQLQILNRWLSAALKPVQAVLPARLTSMPLPLPLGELLLVARRGPGD